MSEKALGDQRNPEGQEQSIQVVELVQPSQHTALDHDSEDGNHQRYQQQRPPVANAKLRECYPGENSAHHV